jgi:hypothetical protein
LTEAITACRQALQLWSRFEQVMRLRFGDGYPADTLAGGNGSGVSDPTGNVATTKARLDYGDAVAMCNQLRQVANDLRGDMHRVLKDNDAWRMHKCNGGFGLVGHLEWGDPTCEEIVGVQSELGLCDRHRKRRVRWQREKGMVP